MSRYFSETYEISIGNVNIKLDLPNYAKKSYLKGETGIHKSTLESKTDSAKLFLLI